MANSGGIRAGKTFIEVYADKTQLGRDLASVEKTVAAFGSKVTGIGKAMFAGGAALLAPLAGAAKEFADLGSQFNDMSARTGASVESLSTLGYAAKQSGSDLEGLETGLRKMQKNIGAAAEGSQEARDALAGLGIKLTDISDMTPDDQFRAIAGAVSEISNPTEKAAAAMSIFGKSGTSLLPMLEDGAEGLAKMEQRARDLGLEFSTGDAKAADSLGDSLDELWAQLKMGTAQIGGALAPALMELTGVASGFLTKAIAWIRENRELIATVFKVAAGVAIAGTAAIALGTAIGAASTIFGAAGAVIGVVTTAIAALLSPIGLVSAAAVGLGYYLLTSTEMGQGALTWLGESFTWLKDEALGAWEGISDALAAGDLALAAKIAWAAIKAVFLEGTHGIRSLWTDMTFSLSSGLIDATAGLEATWLEVTDFFADAWRIVCDGIMGAWDSTIGFVQKLWVRLKSLLGQKVDVEGEVSAIDAANESEARKREDARNKEIGDRDALRQKKRGQIEKDRLGAQETLKEDAGKAQEALTSEEQEARAELDALKAEAKAKREGLPSPGQKPLGTPDFDELEISPKAAKLTKGISGEDIRTSAGMKSLFDSLRGANDPAKETAATLKGMARLQERQWRDGKMTADAVSSLQTSKFK